MTECPFSAKVESILKLACKFAAAQDAPSIRVDPILSALLMDAYPPYAKDILEVLKEVRDTWRREVSGESR